MKRTRFLALTLVVALALVGAGYAYWSDTLTIENSVKTGYLDVDFADSCTGSAFMNYSTNPDEVEDPLGIMEASCDVVSDLVTNGEQDSNNDKLTVTVDNLYPDGMYVVDGTIVNHSTIPVDLHSISYTLTGLPTAVTDIDDLTDFLFMEVWIDGEKLEIPMENTDNGTVLIPNGVDVHLAESNTVNDLDTRSVQVVVKLDKDTPNGEGFEGFGGDNGVVLTVKPNFQQFNYTE